jgi:hypothetical protein
LSEGKVLFFKNRAEPGGGDKLEIIGAASNRLFQNIPSKQAAMADIPQFPIISP